MIASQLDNETISKAEQARLALHHQEVAELLKFIPDFTVEALAELTPEQINNFMRALRIRVDTFGKQFNQTILAPRATPFLIQAKILLDYYYSAPVIRTAAVAMEFSPDGSEYMMLAEMWRDIASYCLKLAALTGNTALIVDANRAYDKAIQVGGKDKSAGLLAGFEKQFLRAQLGQSIDLDTMSGDWWKIVKLSATAGGPDRAATASWKMVKVAKLYKHELLLMEAKQICREHANQLPGGYIKFAARQLARGIATATKEVTYQGNEAELRLAPKTMAGVKWGV